MASARDSTAMESHHSLRFLDRSRNSLALCIWRFLHIIFCHQKAVPCFTISACNGTNTHLITQAFSALRSQTTPHEIRLQYVNLV